MACSSIQIDLAQKILQNKNERSHILQERLFTTNTGTKGERTRAEIIQVAHRLFLDRGQYSTSMRHIANEAGIALGGICNHFSSKDEIFAAVLGAYHPHHEVLPALRNAAGETIEDYVRDAALSMITVLDKRPDFLNLMYIEIVEFKQQHLPDLFERFSMVHLMA